MNISLRLLELARMCSHEIKRCKTLSLEYLGQRQSQTTLPVIEPLLQQPDAQCFGWRHAILGETCSLCSLSCVYSSYSLATQLTSRTGWLTLQVLSGKMALAIGLRRAGVTLRHVHSASPVKKYDVVVWGCTGFTGSMEHT